MMSPLVHAWSASKVVWHFHLPSSEHYSWHPGTCMDLTTAARSTIRSEIQLARIRLAWPDPTRRLDTLSPVPTPSGILLVIHRPTSSGFVLVIHRSLPFRLLSLQATNAGVRKNVQGKDVGDTPHKSSHSTTVSLCIN